MEHPHPSSHTTKITQSQTSDDKDAKATAKTDKISSQERTDDDNVSKEQSDIPQQERTDDDNVSKEQSDTPQQERTDNNVSKEQSNIPQQERTDNNVSKEQSNTPQQEQDESSLEYTILDTKAKTVALEEDTLSTAESTIITKQAQQILDLEKHIDYLKNQILRSLADQENTRQRGYKELQEARKYSMSDFAREVLTVSDNMKRAIEAISGQQTSGQQTTPLLDKLLEGIQVTEKSLFAIFERFSIKKIPIKPLETIYDPYHHQVMYEVAGTGKSPGTIIQVLQDGYTIHERLLRDALVVVAKEEVFVPDHTDIATTNTVTINQTHSQHVPSTEEQDKNFSKGSQGNEDKSHISEDSTQDSQQDSQEVSMDTPLDQKTIKKEDSS